MRRILSATRLVGALALTLLATGCLNSGSGGGYTATGASRVGDGIPSTARDRNSLEYGGPDGCSDGTTLTLVPEAGAVTQTVCGVATTDTAGNPIYTYKGIPYADTTAGDNRWLEAKPPTEPSVRAVEYGPQCIQGKSADYDPTQTSEDCLYVNVWLPQAALNSSAKLPVMVFIHGGAFVMGSGGTAAGDAPGKLNLYDGRQFLATAHGMGQDVVFVTLNYRLGVLGFLAGDKLGLNGNFGIKDQTKALEWVQRNVALFGGDPTQVMIFGESAGGQSTALHLTITANNHQKLFRRAALESNYGMSYMTVKEAQAKVDSFSKQTNCKGAADVLKCLRALPVTTILDDQMKGAFSADNLACAGMQAFLPWNPVIDGSFITNDPINLKASKPILVGSNLSESIPFFAGIADKDALSTQNALMTLLFGFDTAEDVMSKYVTRYPGATNLQRLEHVVTDYMWTCFNRNFANKVPTNTGDAYRYHDVHHGAFSVWGDTSTVGQACSTDPNVCHADELPFVFGNPTNAQLNVQSFTQAEINMSTALQQYWLQFAAGTGTPNGRAQITVWPQQSSGRYLQFQAPASAISAQSGTTLEENAYCSYWDTKGYTVTDKWSDCVNK